MDKEAWEAAQAQQLTEGFSDYLDGIQAEEFDPLEAERWLAAAEELDGLEDSFDAVSAQAAFRKRHGELFSALGAPGKGSKEKRPLHLRRFLPRAAGIAAAAAVVMALAAQGLGVDLFRHAASWTRGEFTFSTGEGERPDAECYSDGQAALDAYDVRVDMMPTWNPAWEGEDIPGLEVTVTEEADGTLVFTEDHRTQTGEGYTFVVYQCEDAGAARARIQGQDAPDTLVYDFGGRSYYIAALGEGQYQITWAVDRYFGQIFGDMDLEQAKHFVRSITEENQWEYTVPDMSVPPKYDTIQEAMEAVGIDTSYAPAWLPEGFVTVESDTFASEEGGWYTAYLFATDVEGERNLSLSFDLRTNPDGVGTTVYPKDDTPIVTFEKSGVTFYIISNGAWRSVAWMDGGMAGSIGGNLTEEECRQMVDAIPRYASR